MITNGRYKARAAGEVILGTSSEKKTPFIELYFEIQGGENAGGRARWTGYFGPNSSERTIESLQTCGWEGDDLSEFSDGALHGLDVNEVEIVVELEEYTNKEGEKRTRPRVQWVNKPGGYLNVQNAMDQAAAQDFGERMKGLVLKVRSKKPEQGDGAEFNFGANAQQPKAAAAGGRKF